ncbi:MAG TPA: GH1 family beta-glucosidase [Myxococcales bacterium]|nr:GH1 family beta-glucosidase [Myxococcales bacterium]
MTTPAFPRDFLWGAATSAYQIEGATQAGGRGESIWDRFCATAGKISDGSNGTIACDHYRRYLDDVALMRDLDVRAYRFSIAWPRVLPTGRGTPNAEGLDFYDGLVDALLEAGITPVATLNHWDLPQKLEDAGGWPARDTVNLFVEYAEAASRRLGDRVSCWATHNEPWCIATLGYESGEHAPGLRDPDLSLRASHHLLLSHARALPVLRGNAKDAQAGLVVNLVPMHPASQSAFDLEAARIADGLFNRWYLDPVFKGSYPADAVAERIRRGQLPHGMHFVQPGDLQEISAPIDWLGVNYYSRGIVRSERIPEASNDERILAVPTNVTEMGWEVYPDGLREILERVHRDYAPKRIYVTENGAAYGDAPNHAGTVHDERRVEYLRGHLQACNDAIAAGVPLGGYFLWSLLDNFEWQFGYTKRFGAVWVDFETQERVLKESARFYRDFIGRNAVPNLPAARSA